MHHKFLSKASMDLLTKPDAVCVVIILEEGNVNNPNTKVSQNSQYTETSVQGKNRATELRITFPSKSQLKKYFKGRC